MKVILYSAKIPWLLTLLFKSIIASCQSESFRTTRVKKLMRLVVIWFDCWTLVNVLHWLTMVVDGESLLPLEATLIFGSRFAGNTDSAHRSDFSWDRQTSFTGLHVFYPQSRTKSLGHLGNEEIYLCFTTWKSAAKNILQKRVSVTRSIPTQYKTQ